MHNYLDINHINVFIGGILLVLSVVMFMIPIQKTERWRNFRTGRNTLATAYIVLGVLMVINGVMGDDDRNPSGMITLIVAFFQALLYTKICILFLKPRSFSGLHYRILLAASAIFSAGLATSYALSQETFRWLFPVGIALYTLLLIYCCLAFTRNYNETLKHLEYVYDEDMYYRIRWVKGCFYSALIVGVMAWFMAVFYNSVTLNIWGIFLYSIYYLCMVGYFMKYVSDYGFILKIDEGEAAPPNSHSVENKQYTASETENRQLTEKLEKWAEMKKYRDCSKTMDDIVAEIGTSRPILNEHMNSQYGMSFRAWRNILRIEEAKRLLKESDVPVAEIYSAVGFTDRSNFHTAFKETVGLTPNQYRTNHRR